MPNPPAMRETAHEAVRELGRGRPALFAGLGRYNQTFNFSAASPVARFSSVAHFRCLQILSCRIGFAPQIESIPFQAHPTAPQKISASCNRSSLLDEGAVHNRTLNASLSRLAIAFNVALGVRPGTRSMVKANVVIAGQAVPQKREVRLVEADNPCRALEGYR